MLEAIRWIESCGCHGELLKNPELDEEVKKAWLKCPLRGRRAVDLASGEFLRVFQQLADSSVAHFVASLPRSLGEAERRQLLQEFNVARAHLFFYFSVKLADWSCFPLRAFRVANSNAEIAKEELRKILELPRDFTCPQLDTLRGQLRHQGERWLQGAELTADELRELRGYLAGLRLTPTCERRGEGQHAKSHHRGLGRGHHTEQFQSYGLRSGEIEAGGCHVTRHLLQQVASPSSKEWLWAGESRKQLPKFRTLTFTISEKKRRRALLKCGSSALHCLGFPRTEALLADQPRRVHRLALLTQLASRSKKAANVVGLVSHPALMREALHTRHPLYGQVIYHADSWSLYAQELPALTFSDTTHHGGPELQRADADLEGAPEHLDQPDVAEHPAHGEMVDGAQGANDLAQQPAAVVEDAGAPRAPNRALRQVLADHNGIRDLLSKYLLQHLRTRLAELNTPTYCIVKLPGLVAETALKSVSTLLHRREEPVAQDLR